MFYAVESTESMKVRSSELAAFGSCLYTWGPPLLQPCEAVQGRTGREPGLGSLCWGDASRPMPRLRSPFGQKQLGSFRKLGVPYCGVLIIRILLFRVLCWGPLFSETPTSPFRGVAKEPAIAKRWQRGSQQSRGSLGRFRTLLSSR